MIKPIKNKPGYEKALERVYTLMQKTIKVDSPEANELEVLSILIKEYERKHYPVSPPHRLKQLNSGLTKWV